MGFRSVHVGRGSAHRAASLRGTSQALLEQLGSTRQENEAKLADKDYCKLRRALGPDGFDEAFAEGRRLAATWWQMDRPARFAALLAPPPWADGAVQVGRSPAQPTVSVGAVSIGKEAPG